MIMIIVEKLWNTETQILHDDYQLHLQILQDQKDVKVINQKRIEKRK